MSTRFGFGQEIYMQPIEGDYFNITTPGCLGSENDDADQPLICEGI